MQIDFAKHPVLKQALYIINQLNEAGYAAYFVGGAVRDVLLGRSIQDVDIATSALPEETLKLFPKAFATGLQHGTVTVVHERINYEVTTFRVEDNYVDYRRPDRVAFVRHLELDLARRDFTMNAMAINANGQVVDYFDGRAALQNKILVAVGNPDLRFKEDALRMVRAIRFATTYDLTCDEKLWNAIERLRPLLAYISMERIQQELFKLIKQKKRILNLKLLAKSSLLHYTKKKLYLASILEQWFSEEHPLIENLLEDEQLLWTILYAESSFSLDHIRQDFSALVFPKKMSSDIRVYIQWYRFWQSTFRAINDEKLRQNFIHTHHQYIDLYHDITKVSHQSLKEEQKVNIIAQLYWFEQSLHALHSYTTFNERFISTCVPHSLHELVDKINTSLHIRKLTELNITGKELCDQLNSKAGPWLKPALRLLFFAVNLKLVHNNKEKLQVFALQLRKDGVL